MRRRKRKLEVLTEFEAAQDTGLTDWEKAKLAMLGWNDMK
jgi:hypothetical protein